MSSESVTFLAPETVYDLPRTFNMPCYLETEQELWALFPETDGRRANFVQVGLSAFIYASVPDDESPLKPDETYLLMPCPDFTMRPIRMQAVRRLTLSDYRMAHLTAIKLIGEINEAADVMAEVGRTILGDELLEETSRRTMDC